MYNTSRLGPEDLAGGGGVGVLFCFALSGLLLAAAAAAPQRDAPSFAKLPEEPKPPLDPGNPPDGLAYPEEALSFGLHFQLASNWPGRLLILPS